jgi:spore germination protein KC
MVIQYIQIDRLKGATVQMIRKIWLFPLLAAVFLLCSCWDLVEIEDHAFILGIGIDKAERPDTIKVTFQIALTQAFGGEASSDTDAVWNVEVMAEDMRGAQAELLKTVNLQPTLEHCQILLFGEAYARQGLKENLDYFFRNPRARLRTTVAVVQGEASNALEIQPKTTKTSARYLRDIIMTNGKDNFEINQYNDIASIERNTFRGSSITLPRIIPGDDKVIVTGAAAFNEEYKLTGWYSGEEAEGIAWIRGDFQRGSISIRTPDTLGSIAVLYVFHATSSLKPEFRDGQLIAKNNINIEGDIIEFKKRVHGITLKELNHLEELFEKEIGKKIRHGFLKARDEFKQDHIEFDNKVMNYFPRYWEEHHDEWNGIFQNVDLDLKVNVRIRRMGDIR